MKFLLFSDFHYGPDLFIGGTMDTIKLFRRRAEEEGCDFIIHGGDFSFGRPEDMEIVREYRNFHIPSYHTFGNHDANHSPYEQVLKEFGLTEGHFYFDCKGYRFIACDPNYFKDGDNYYHYTSKDGHATRPDSPSVTGDHMPPEQIRWLRETIDSSPFPCLIISHQSFEREADGVKERKEVLDVINKANKKRPHSVLMCMNGHYHRDNFRIMDGVLYWDVNAVTYDWVAKRHNLFPEDMCAKMKHLSHTVAYNDPLYAIVTLEGSHIKIEGMESSMFMGVTREMTDNPPLDPAGRPATPRIQSLDITL